MEIQKKEKLTNGKTFGFDNEADFIPFELSDDEEVDDSRPESPAVSIGRTTDLIPPPSSPLASDSSTKITNGDGRKRKRREYESSPERGPPPQRQKFKQETVNPWQTDINDYASYKETSRMLHKEVQDFSNWISPTKKEDEVRRFVVEKVIASIESGFPQCRAFAFGSFNTKLYVPDADIDMVVSRPGHTWTNSSMRQLARHIERNGIGRNFQYIFGAKVPIIKFVDTYARIDIDLSFNQTNALEVVTLVQRYLHEMPAVRPLVMILKTLFRQKNLSIPAEGGLGSYSIICMVISFLQRHPKIAAGHILPDQNLGAMLIEILELYGTRFNFDRVGIAIDHGGGFYFEKLQFQLVNQHIWKKICIRDPNDSGNNIAKASHQSENIIKVFRDAFRELTTRCYLVHARIKAGEDSPWGTECGSILDAIIERPLVMGRNRLEGIWKDNMSEIIDLDARPTTETRSPAETVPSMPKKPNRQERRAMEKAAKERARNNHPNDSAKPAIIISHQPPSPTKAKVPTAIATATGTRDTPILLEDSSNPPSPVVATRSSPAKKKRSTINWTNNAAVNLKATGSISGVARNTVSLE